MMNQSPEEDDSLDVVIRQERRLGAAIRCGLVMAVAVTGSILLFFVYGLYLLDAKDRAGPLGSAAGTMLSITGALGILWLTRHLDRQRKRTELKSEAASTAIALLVEASRIKNRCNLLETKIANRNEMPFSQMEVSISPIYRATSPGFTSLPFHERRYCLLLAAHVDFYQFEIDASSRKGNNFDTIDLSDDIRTKLSSLHQEAITLTRELNQYLENEHGISPLLPSILDPFSTTSRS